jgi:LAO/AO transport system kinase
VIETVGVGQAEVEIARHARVTILVLSPGAGDEVQAMKAGIVEVASLFVINKSDLPGAPQLQQELEVEAHGRPVLLAVARDGQGVKEILEAAQELQRGPVLARQSGIVLDHIGVAVSTLDGALEFWLKQLGLDLSLRETVVPENVNVAMLPMGGPRIELLEATTADSTIAKFIEKRGPGIHHIALRVPDLLAAVERLKSGGARVLSDPQLGAGGHLYVFVHPSSTGGVLLELIQG